MSPATDPRFIPLAEEPRNVEPLMPDARAADGRATLRRPMTAPELAGYLAVADYRLAPATDEIRRRTPGTAWICWWNIVSGMPLHGALREAPSLGCMEAQWREAFALKVFIDDVRREVRRALRDGRVEVLDATRAWLLGEPVDPTLVPDVLLRYPRLSLAVPRSFPPREYERLSPAQWRRGAILYRRCLRQRGRGENLLCQARDLVEVEERRRLRAVADAPDVRKRRYL